MNITTSKRWIWSEPTFAFQGRRLARRTLTLFRSMRGSPGQLFVPHLPATGRPRPEDGDKKVIRGVHLVARNMGLRRASRRRLRSNTQRLFLTKPVAASVLLKRSARQRGVASASLRHSQSFKANKPTKDFWRSSSAFAYVGLRSLLPQVKCRERCGLRTAREFPPMRKHAAIVVRRLLAFINKVSYGNVPR